MKTFDEKKEANDRVKGIDNLTVKAGYNESVHGNEGFTGEFTVEGLNNTEMGLLADAINELSDPVIKKIKELSEVAYQEARVTEAKRCNDWLKINGK